MWDTRMPCRTLRLHSWHPEIGAELSVLLSDSSVLCHSLLTAVWMHVHPTVPLCFWRIGSSVCLRISDQLSGTQDLYWSPLFSPLWPVYSLNLLVPGLINVFAAFLHFQKDGTAITMHQAAKQQESTDWQTGRQASGCQAEYSYKFNEHPDSREFVAPAQSSLYTHRLMRLDTLMEQVGVWQFDLGHEQSSSLRTQVCNELKFLFFKR